MFKRDRWPARMAGLPHRAPWCAIALAALVYTGPVAAADQIAALLARDEPPPGVVFEIVEGRESDLEWALPAVQDYAERLRRRFPGIGVAVVSHGREEFALLERRRQDFLQVHQLVWQLGTEQDIPVHVCGAHASWYDFSAEDFPDYVDVPASGPGQIADYENIGYVKVVLERGS